MSGFRSLATRLVIAMLIPLSLLQLAATWVETRTASRTMISTAETAAENLGATVREELQGVLRSMRVGTEALTIPLSRLETLDLATVEEIQNEALARSQLVYGTALALEPMPDGSGRLAPYAYQSPNGIVHQDLAEGDYRYWDWPWFTEPLESGESRWSDPYFDEGAGNARMVTYSVPLEVTGRRAVLTADLELGFLSDIAGSNLLGRPGAVFLFDRGGNLVAHPVDRWLLRKRLSEIAAEQKLFALEGIQRVISDSEDRWIRPDEGMHEGIIGGNPDRPGRLLLIPLREAGWGIGVYFSDDDFLADIEEATRFRLLFALTLLILLASILALVSMRSLRPLRELADRTRAIAQGEFRGDTPGLNRRDEIGRLSRAFHRMQEHLQDYIEDLTQATAARERIDAELTTARLLQHALLPREHPDPAEVGADLAASLQSARAVGGDLFNYVRLNDDRLFFVIGDVSDKGVPAALFMTRANALLKSEAARGVAPERVLERVNLALCEDNELCMFVTLLAGMLDLESGKLRLASAGHEHPFHLDSKGSIKHRELDNGPPLGIDDTANYSGADFTLAKGDLLVCYTDGITEARNPAGELFGEAQLEVILGRAPRARASDIVFAVHEAVERYADGAEQADDLTLLVLRRSVAVSEKPEAERHGPTMSGQLSVPLRENCHVQVIEKLQAEAAEAGTVLPDSGDLRLVMEEVLTNVVKYSGAAERGLDAKVSWHFEQGRLELVFEDPGQPFNPLDERMKYRDEDDHSDGGMGIQLVRSIATTVHYERIDQLNRLEVTLSAT
ncbi:MAG: SpoIIE family protein phosphatase [Pseudomonadota bacterium]